MINEIKEMLERGEIVELECVDRGGFLKDTSRREANEKILDQGPLVVGYIEYDGDIRLVGGIGDIYLNVIANNELKHFRIKSYTPTFDDLIEVAVRGVRDKVVVINKMEVDYIEIGVVDIPCDIIVSKNHDGDEVGRAISCIKSLYTETFVIETVDDYLKINNTSEIKINESFIVKGEKILSDVKSVRAKLERNGILLDDNFYFDMLSWLLKGATVTQKLRGQ